MLVPRVPKVTKDIKEHQELTLVKVLKVMMVHKVLKDIKEHQELTLVKVHKDIRVIRDTKEMQTQVHKVLPALEIQVLKVILVHKVLLELKDIRVMLALQCQLPVKLVHIH
jgi:pyrimidine operon attenuation protein/uracil phosphoribosyltransferase